MKITDIAMTPLWLPFKEPYHWAGRVDYGAAVVLVEVETDDGLIGIGESTARVPRRGHGRGAAGRGAPVRRRSPSSTSSAW